MKFKYLTTFLLILISPKLLAETAIFAMGCFWCAEAEFRNLDNSLLAGIANIQVGYAGGKIANPDYSNHPGYKEAVKLEFDPSIISYAKLLDIFWHNIDPLDAKGQFCDKGFAYTAVIFYTTESQKQQAASYKDKLKQQFKQDIKTEILPATTFYPAEEYHQNYKHKNPVRYKFYRWNCGRDQKLKQLWN